MTKTKILLLSVLSMLIMVSSCKKDDDPVVQAEELLKFIESYITPASLPGYITAEALDVKVDSEDDMLILDIRSLADYDIGHIIGAKHSDHKLVLEYLQTNSIPLDKDIYVACYSGQSAAWATALIKVAGYTNAKSLKFGMSGWLTGAMQEYKAAAAGPYDKWSANVSDDYWMDMVTTASAAKPAKGNLPDLSEGSDIGANILDARLDAIFAEGFAAICATDAPTFVGGELYDNDNYFVINYWPEADYEHGHIPNALNYEPATDPFTLAMDIMTLPKDKTILVYCYTGQTSAYMTAYLRLIGYNAKTLKFGANSMMYDHMPLDGEENPKSRWSPPTVERDVVATITK